MLLSKRFVEPRVLLIEDAEETQELSRLALESQACQVTAVSSAEAALGLLNAGEPFDLLFTDVCLGGISGIETANRVRASAAAADPGHLRHGPASCAAAAARRHPLPKPYSMSELLDAIRLLPPCSGCHVDAPPQARGLRQSFTHGVD